MNLDVKTKIKLGKLNIKKAGSRFLYGFALIIGSDVETMSEYVDYLKELDGEKEKLKQRIFGR